MATELFDFAAKQIERRTSFDRLESRGTLRIVLKQAGLEAKTVTASQMCVAIDQLLAEELEKRGIGEAAAICRSLIQSVADAPTNDSDLVKGVDEIFGRLGGN